jgi:hypothetical protein
MESISELVHQHLVLTKEAILDRYKNILPFNDYDKSVDVIYRVNSNSDTVIDRLETGERFVIPGIMMTSLERLYTQEYLSGLKIPDKDSSLLLILSELSHHQGNIAYLDINGFELLGIIRECDLSTLNFRRMIYKILGIIPGYIEYSSPTDINFY